MRARVCVCVGGEIAGAGARKDLHLNRGKKAALLQRDDKRTRRKPMTAPAGQQPRAGDHAPSSPNSRVHSSYLVSSSEPTDDLAFFITT